MLTIQLGEDENWDEVREVFTYSGGTTLRLEHSLVSLSKWEEIWEKPFLSKDDKTPEQILSYIQCMILDQNTPPEILEKLDQKTLDGILAYMGEKRTATWFNNLPTSKKNPEVITSELIYYWLVAFEIPFEPTNTWYLNRLLTLVRVCNAKNAKPKKQTGSERAAAAAERSRLNAERLAKYDTTG